MRRFIGLLIGFAAWLPLGGCLITTHRDRVVRQDEPRQQVRFESDQGMVDFRNAVRRRGLDGARERGRSSFNLPFIISANHRDVLSWPAFFNDQVRLADFDGDGTISDAEAAAYAGA